MKLPEYFRKIKPGEAVLVEYTARSQAPLIFKDILKTFGIEKTLVIDVADIGMTFKKILDLAGMWNRDFSEVKVIKLGGKIKWGNVLGHYDIYTDPRVFIEKMGSMVESKFPGRRVVVALGTERVPIIHSDLKRVALDLAECASTKLGDPSLIVIYFINRDVAEGEFIGIMRDVATRVILADKGRIKIIKSPLIEDMETLKP